MDKMSKSSPIFSTVENNNEVSMTTSPIPPEDFAAFSSDDNILGEIAKMKQEELDKKFPRVRLAHLPTPLEFCPRLTEALGGVEIYVKRDDCTGLATGGNKARKLEWLMAEAIEQDAEYVMTQGATQSNHARQTAAACSKLGFKCHILLEDRTNFEDMNYRGNGNVLLDDLFGATREEYPGGANMNEELEKVAQEYREKFGAKVYPIVGGGSDKTGALGYVNCVYEMIQQFDEKDLDIDYIVHATGSAGTQAGLVTGLKSVSSASTSKTNKKVPELIGFGVRAPKETQEGNVFNLAQKTADYISDGTSIDTADVTADCSYVGDGYGIPSKGGLEAIRMFAELEGLLLDPVYSAKGAAGLIDYCRKGIFKAGDKVVFIHTGGSAALHGYINYFN